MFRNIFSVVAGVLTASLLFGIGGLVLLISQLNKAKGHGEETDVASITSSFTIFTVLLIIIAMVIGAFITVKISTRKDLAHGMITGLVCCVLFAIITEFDMSADSLVPYLIILSGAAAGTWIGMLTKKKNPL